MNHLFDNDPEWLAQERALQDERRDAAGSEDPLQARYRQVARALRQPLPHALPDDFAARVAALAAAEARDGAVDTAVEQRLVRALVALLGLSAAMVAALYGQQWLQAILAVLPGVAFNWTLALLACVGLSWSFERLRGHRLPHGQR